MTRWSAGSVAWGIIRSLAVATAVLGAAVALGVPERSTAVARRVIGAPAPLPMPPVRRVPSPIYGMTQDDVSNLAAIVDASRHLARTPTHRIVFDVGVPPARYASVVTRLRPVSFVMGELLDSAYVKSTSVRAYHDRAVSYLTTLGSNVDVWEVGNEVNGEWLGSTASVVAKIGDAYDQAMVRGYPTAMTLYYNPGCWLKSSNEMMTWARANVPLRMKGGLDYVFISYYEQDCNGFRPTTAQWQQVFDDLRLEFPAARLGFGEIGTRRSSTHAYKRAYMERYYGMPITTPGYVGGYFWWYANEDLLPWRTKQLWKTFHAVTQTY